MFYLYLSILSSSVWFYMLRLVLTVDILLCEVVMWYKYTFRRVKFVQF